MRQVYALRHDQKQQFHRKGAKNTKKTGAYNNHHYQSNSPVPR
jgi:uncharacterized protein YjlB